MPTYFFRMRIWLYFIRHDAWRVQCERNKRDFYTRPERQHLFGFCAEDMLNSGGMHAHNASPRVGWNTINEDDND